MTSQVRHHLVIDTDAGIDDAHAILMALACPDVEIVGFTTTHGNTDAHQVARNLLRLLKVAGRLDVPIYVGCESSLVGGSGNASHYHGLDGFGDVPDPNPPDPSLIQKDHAVLALLRLANEYSGNLTLMGLGPLTNVAMAIRMDPTFGSKLKDCFIMGGNYEGKGNISLCAEFNFHNDPEAASIVLNELGCHITLACWELCLKHSLSWDIYAELRSGTSSKSQFMKTIEAQTMEKCKSLNWPTYVPCDEIAMAAALLPAVVLEYINRYVTVELSGTFARGQMIVDWNNQCKRQPNAKIIMNLDINIYQTILEKVVK